MKKRFFAIYALVGALVASPIFTSCVDDNESASVTALRGAKAEQLKSVAEMNKAEAQAKLVYANAEAALKAAEAAVQQAKAQKIAAEAKIKELEAQLKQDAYDAELAAALAKAEAEKAEAEKDIAIALGQAQKNQLKLEAKIAELQAALLKAKNELVKAEDGAANAQYVRLNKLATKYSTLLASYTTEQNNLANLKIEKLALEADLVDLNEAKEKQIASNNATIAVIDQQIAYLKEYENYREDVETLQNERTVKQAEADKALDAKNALQKKLQKAYTDFNENEELKDMLDAINENELVKMYNNYYSSDYVFDNRWYSYEDIDGDGDFEFVFAGGKFIRFSDYNPIANYDIESCEVEKENYTTLSHDSLVVEVEAKDLRRLALDIDEAIAGLDIAAMKESVNKATTGLKAVYDAKVAATATAKAAYEAAKTDATKKAAYETALAEEEQAKTAYEVTMQIIETAEETKARLEELYALVSTDTTELLEAVEAYNQALHTEFLAIAEIQYAYEDAEKVLTDLNAELDAMDAVLTGNAETEVTLYDYIIQKMNSWYNWSSLSFGGYKVNFAIDHYDWEGNYQYTDHGTEYIHINLWNAMLTINSNEINGAVTIKNLIEGFETQKETLLAANEDISAITTKEQAIASKDAEIAGKEAVVAALEVELSAAKAALDAAMPAEEEEGTEEAPEEGTEEA